MSLGSKNYILFYLVVAPEPMDPPPDGATSVSSELHKEDKPSLSEDNVESDR